LLLFTASKFVALLASPDVQAEGIVSKLDAAVWQKLFADISPEERAAKGKPFPLGQSFNEILEANEKKGAN
jgi:putative spermidine/putrescine transport system substrate-binding protein